MSTRFSSSPASSSPPGLEPIDAAVDRVATAMVHEFQLASSGRPTDHENLFHALSTHDELMSFTFKSFMVEAQRLLPVTYRLLEELLVDKQSKEVRVPVALFLRYFRLFRAT